jgi:hypothetical protein
MVLLRDECLGDAAGSELLDALRIARLVGWASVVVDLLTAGALPCDELTALICELRDAVNGGMKVSIASTDRRLINVLDLTRVPVVAFGTVSDARAHLNNGDS